MQNFLKKIVITILTWQARVVILHYKPKVIAVTGSVGKTSTKDAIFTALSRFKKVRKSEKSYNSEIGIPLTILGLENGWNNPLIWLKNIIKGFGRMCYVKTYPEWLVLEVGAGKPKDITSVTAWLSPDVAVITHFPDRPVHIEFFGNVEKIIEEKSALAFALKKNGTLILNHDDAKVYALHEKVDRKSVSYGKSENSTYKATYPSYIYSNGSKIPSGINFKLVYDGNTFPVTLHNIIGFHYIDSALAALAVSNEIGCDLLGSIETLAAYTAPPGRLSLIAGINGSTIIDDSYNSSPLATIAALSTLKNIEAKRKIAVLGDMLELGKITEEAHREIGREARDIVDMLVTVGPRAKFIANGALDAGFASDKIKIFDNSFQAVEFLKENLSQSDLVLVKGSQGVRLEKIVAAIIAEPNLAPKLLARQDKEWQNR